MTQSSSARSASRSDERAGKVVVLRQGDDDRLEPTGRAERSSISGGRLDRPVESSLAHTGDKLSDRQVLGVQCEVGARAQQTHHGRHDFVRQRRENPMRSIDSLAANACGDDVHRMLGETEHGQRLAQETLSDLGQGHPGSAPQQRPPIYASRTRICCESDC